MQDFCFKANAEAPIVAALQIAGLTTADETGNPRPVGDYCFAGQIVETPGQYDPDTGAEISPPVYLPGVYAAYRATDAQAAAILTLEMPEGVTLVDPPAGLPLWGGEWLGGPSLAEVKAQACARIEAERQRRLAAEIRITWPDGVRSQVQTRDLSDWFNINSIAAAGLAATIQGVDPGLYFRDADNANHALTPTQAVDFGFQAVAAGQALAKASHDAKDAIWAEGVTTAAQVAAIEAAVIWSA
ncbi:DUF4376 domain-containing protein [Solidesulfovibrio sp.]